MATTASMKATWLALCLGCFLSLAETSTPAGATAQSGQAMPESASKQLLRKWTIPVPPELQATTKSLVGEEIGPISPWTFPSSSLLTPTAYGSNWGDFFAGLTFNNRARFGLNVDGNLAVGFGLWNAVRAVGIEVVFGMDRLHLILPWQSGSISVKVHRLFRNGWGVAAGVDRLISFAGSDAELSVYGVVSKYYFLSRNETDWFSLLFLHAGVGNWDFLTQVTTADSPEYASFFASMGIRILRPVSFVANWYNSDLALGLSFAPFRNTRLTLTTTVQDVLGTAGDSARFMVNLAYAGSFVDVLETLD